MARQEFEDHKQHPDEPALAYIANKRLLFNKGCPREENLEILRTKAQEDLYNIAVKRDLIKEEFSTYEQLQD